MAAMVTADEEPIEGGKGVLPLQICGGNRSSVISNVFYQEYLGYYVRLPLSPPIANNFMRDSTSRVTPPCYTS